jgi:hypothetical protein
VVRSGLDASVLEYGPVASSTKHANDLLGSIKVKEFHY